MGVPLLDSGDHDAESSQNSSKNYTLIVLIVAVLTNIFWVIALFLKIASGFDVGVVLFVPSMLASIYLLVLAVRGSDPNAAFLRLVIVSGLPPLVWDGAPVGAICLYAAIAVAWVGVTWYEDFCGTVAAGEATTDQSMTEGKEGKPHDCESAIIF